MLLTFEPGAGVCLLVRHHVDTIALSLVELVEAFVAAAVRVLLHAEAVHFLVDPVACVLFAVGPSVSAKAFNVPLLVFPCVSLTIGPLLDTVSVALVHGIASEELGTVRVRLFADSLHDALAELPFIDKEVHVSRHAFSVVHVVGPLSLIRLTLDLREFAVTMGVAKIPRAFIRSTILEAHNTAAMADSAQPLAIIGSARRAIAMHAHLKLLLQLGLAAEPEKIDHDDFAFGDGLHGVPDQELLAILSAFFSGLQVLDPLQLASPGGLDLDDPVGVDAAILAVLVCSVASARLCVIYLGNVGATARPERI